MTAGPNHVHASDGRIKVVPQRLYELVNGPDEAGSQRAMEAMLKMSKLDVAELEAAYAAPGDRVGA